MTERCCSWHMSGGPGDTTHGYDAVDNPYARRATQSHRDIVAEVQTGATERVSRLLGDGRAPTRAFGGGTAIVVNPPRPR